YRQVSDDQRQESEAQPGFGNRQRPAGRPARGHVSIAKREKGRTAQINIGSKTMDSIQRSERRPQRPMQRRESKNQPQRPKHQQHDQRERAVETQKRLAPAARGYSARHRRTGNPRRSIKETRQPESPRYSPRKNDRFKRIKQDDENQKYAENSDGRHHKSDLCGLPAFERFAIPIC